MESSRTNNSGNPKDDLLFQKTISIKEYPSLKDHAFNHQIIIPAVLYLEFLDESAHHFFKDHILTTINKIDYNQTLTLQSDETIPLFCQFTNQITNDDKITLQGDIYYYYEKKSIHIRRKKNIVHFELILSRIPLEPDEHLNNPYINYSSIVIDKNEIYPHLVGLGKSFNHLEHVLQISRSSGALGLIKKSQENNIPTNDLLLGDMYIRDSAYHLPSIWGNHFKGGFNIPYSMTNIHFYHRLKSYQDYYVKAIPLTNNPQDSEYQLIITTTEGLVIEYYDKIKYTHQLNFQSHQNTDLITSRIQKVDQFENLSHNLTKLFPHSGIWELSFIQRNRHNMIKSLNDKELIYYHQYKRDKNQLEYLGGRVLLKSLIINYYKELNKDLSFLDINTPRNHDGSISLFIRSEPIDDLYFSISHKDQYIFVVASPSQIGVDVEKISDKLVKLKSKYINNTEDHLIHDYHQSTNHHPLENHYCRLWTAKESLVKLTKGNLLDTFKKSQLAQIDKDQLILTYPVENKVKHFLARHHILDDYLFTTLVETVY